MVEEAETPALEHTLAAWPLCVSSVVAAVEVPRAAARASRHPAVEARAADVVASLTLLGLDRGIVRSAAALGPVEVRSLDAIHLASALSLGRELGGFVAYDRRLADAAHAASLPVLAPA